MSEDKVKEAERLLSEVEGPGRKGEPDGQTFYLTAASAKFVEKLLRANTSIPKLMQSDHLRGYVDMMTPGETRAMMQQVQTELRRQNVNGV